MTAWSIACWLTLATDTLSVYVMHIAFPLQQLLRESSSLLRYTYIASHLFFCRTIRVAPNNGPELYAFDNFPFITAHDPHVGP